MNIHNKVLATLIALTSLLLSQTVMSENNKEIGQRFQLIDEDGKPISNRNYNIFLADAETEEDFVPIYGAATDKDGYSKIIKSKQQLGIVYSYPVSESHDKAIQKCTTESQKKQRDLQPTYKRITVSDSFDAGILTAVITEKVTCEYQGV